MKNNLTLVNPVASSGGGGGTQTVIGSGAAGTAASGVVTIQGITSMTPVTVAGTITNVPSGTQTVGGTVTNVPSGTQTVGGTVTNVPSGTQTVGGTVTNVPSGTQTVGGTVTNVPSGTQTVAGTGVAGTAASGVVTIQGIASMTPVTVAGTVTHVPSGTQTVVGTVTNVPSGTQTVAGTVTHVPSGTQTVSGTVTVLPTTSTSGGLALPTRDINVGTSGVNVKASAGQVYGWVISNTSTAVRYLKLYNKASAPSSADTPALTIPVPSSATGQFFVNVGIAFGTGIGYRASTGVADNDNTAPGSNEVILHLFTT